MESWVFKKVSLDNDIDVGINMKNGEACVLYECRSIGVTENLVIVERGTVTRIFNFSEIANITIE